MPHELIRGFNVISEKCAPGITHLVLSLQAVPLHETGFENR